MARWAGDDLIQRRLHSLWLMLGALCCLPYAAYGFSFGNTEVHSHLGEPLDIRVPLQLEQGERADRVFVLLAKREVYAQWGLASYMDLSALHMQVHHEKQRMYAAITSNQPMMMALISLIIEAKQGKHQYFKQVKVFLDPPSYQAVSRIYPKHENLSSFDESSLARTKQTTHRAAPSSLPDATQGWARAWRYGPVRSGDSLSTIAYRLRKDKRWSNHQVMLALYRNNVDAFVQQDMNRLKSGVWLDVPRDTRLRVLLSHKPSQQETKKPPSMKVQAASPEPEKKPKLHFVGHISAHIAEQAPRVADDVAVMKGRLDQLYDQSMHVGLRMDGIDATLLDVQHTVQGIEQHVQKLSQQQQSLEQHLHVWSQQSRNAVPSGLWWLGGILLLLNALGFVFLYRKISEKHAAFEEADAGLPVEVEAVDEQLQMQVMQPRPYQETIDNQIYDMEQALDHQDYARAEACVQHIPEAQQNVRVQALKVRLYHESGQPNERNQYVQQQRKQLNEAQWRAFCDRLPSAVWQSLLVAGVVEGLTDPSYVREDASDAQAVPQVDALEDTQVLDVVDIPSPVNEEDFFHITEPDTLFHEGDDSDDFGSFSVAKDESEVAADEHPMMDVSFAGFDDSNEEVSTSEALEPVLEPTYAASIEMEEDDPIQFSAWSESEEKDDDVPSYPVVDDIDDALDFDVQSLFEGEDMTIKKSSEV